MQQAKDIPEVIVSDGGAAIPADILRAAGINPGDRVAFVRTTRGALVVLAAATEAAGPSLRPVTGICPRPADWSPEEDEAFLQDIRHGDEGP
jgi:bifunctional DNA-binding transcriptional regulator/antitoxin component of YhaV-PrlF toxin-antitoxin module